MGDGTIDVQWAEIRRSSAVGDMRELRGLLID
jgi:hypothetical protein